MKRYLCITLGLVVCLLLAGISYTWVNSLMDSVFAYRSPLYDNPPAPGEPLGAPLTRRVVFVLVDALREDTALRPEVMPFLDELRQQGASATMHSRAPSYSQSGYTVLFTGAWPDLSDGPALNADYDEIPTWTQDDLFSAAHRSGLKGAVSAFNWFERLIPKQALAASFYTAGEDHSADLDVVNAALPWLRSGEYQLVLIHIDQVDYAGHHEGGPMDARWDAAARRADDLIRQIAASLDLSQDTLFICSDHGQIDRGGHGGHEPIVLIEPFVLVGAAVKPGQYGDVNMVDVAPTLAALLGANLPASSQGRVLTEMLSLSPAQMQTIQQAEQAQQSQLLAAYQAAVGKQVAIQGEDRTVAAHQQTLEATRRARLYPERMLRAGLSLILVLLPLLWVIRRRRAEQTMGYCRNVAWWLAGALLFVLLFHLRYAVLDQRTYTLSSLVSADEVIQYTAITTLIALLAGWLLTMTGLRAWRSAPRQAAVQALGFVFTALYLLALPILWSYTLNGIVAGWTLPDFPSMFLAFLALLQAMVTAAMGVILMGLTALVARIVKSRIAS